MTFYKLKLLDKKNRWVVARASSWGMTDYKEIWGHGVIVGGYGGGSSGMVLYLHGSA